VPSHALSYLKDLHTDVLQSVPNKEGCIILFLHFPTQHSIHVDVLETTKVVCNPACNTTPFAMICPNLILALYSLLVWPIALVLYFELR